LLTAHYFARRRQDSDANTRVVLIGYNSGRGRGSDADMLRMCEAVVAMHKHCGFDSRATVWTGN
jgi:hypothetical protein